MVNDILLDRLYCTLFWWLTFAPFSRSNSTTPLCPYWEATERSVKPFWNNERRAKREQLEHKIPGRCCQRIVAERGGGAPTVAVKVDLERHVREGESPVFDTDGKGNLLTLICTSHCACVASMCSGCQIRWQTRHTYVWVWLNWDDRSLSEETPAR